MYTSFIHRELTLCYRFDCLSPRTDFVRWGCHAHGDFVPMGLSPNLLCVVIMVIYLLSHRGGILPDVM